MSIVEKAKEYIEWDLNEETRNQVTNLLENNDLSSLEKILQTRLQFGTAGLRGPMGPGYNCMNELVILQTCQGLAMYLEETLGLACRDQV
jgi:phosphoglucomutase / phosphopentomutase